MPRSASNCSRFGFKLWFWGFALINEDKEWRDLKLALNAYFTQQHRLFEDSEITIKEFISWAIGEITPFYIE
jgi:hypothetical protein